MSPSDDTTKTMTINDRPDLDYTDLDHLPKMTLGDHLLVEAKRLAGISQKFKLKINSAKTKPKKDYYSKKLKKNNDVLGDIIIRLDEYHNIQNKKKDKG